MKRCKSTQITNFILQLILLPLFLYIIHFSVYGMSTINERKNVLIVHSYNQGFKWTDELHKGITDQLESDYFNIYTEYLDAYRFKETDPNKIDILKSYASRNIDYIIVTDNAAYDAMISIKALHYPSTPILFVGLNGLTASDIPFPDVKGIMQNIDYDEFLQWIHQNMPHITDLIICGADTSTTRGNFTNINTSYNLLSKEQTLFNIHLVISDSYEEQLQQISEYDTATTALYTAGSFGVLNHDQYTDMLATNTNLPTFCGVSTSITNEVIGGFVISPYTHGRLIGETVLRLSRGQSISSQLIIETPIQEIIFNYHGLMKYDIPLSSLPQNAILLNDPQKNIQITPFQLTLILSIIILLFTISLFLLFITHMRKKANLELLKVNLELNSSKMELEAYSEELYASQEELTNQYLQLQESNQTIQNLLDYNQLTKVPNETKFYSLLEERYGEGEPITLIYVSITNLNQLIFTHGKSLYEAILLRITNFLYSLVEEDGILGLTNNNDFVLSKEGTLSKDSELLLTMARYFSTGIQTDLYTIFLRYKIGISYYPKHTTNLTALLQLSSIAITHIFDNSVEHIALYQTDFSKMATTTYHIQREIDEALDTSAFTLYYQPKYNYTGTTIIGLEALIRWNHPDGTLKTPGYFIDIAEQSGQIIQIGLFVIHTACRTIIEHNLMEKQIPIAINLSGQHFAGHDIVDQLQSAIDQYKIPPHMLELEITETSLVINREYGASILNELRSLGFTITLDDFGTGYSSINYIKDLSIDKIKIDHSFTKQIGDPKYLSLIRSLLQMARDLHLKVTVEGIETQEQFRIISELAPDELQGFYFHRPAMIDSINY